MTDHQPSAAIEQAAQWLSEQNPSPSPIVPALRQQFGLSTVEACEAAALSQRFRLVRKAFS